MSIEAMQLALEALNESVAFQEGGRQKAIGAVKALRLALSQQTVTAIACGIAGMAKTTCPYCEQSFAFEHEQPTTGEPALIVEREPNYWSHGHYYEGNKPHINPIKIWSLPIGTKLYTRPAPSVPDEKPLPDLMMASYHEAIGWNACRAAIQQAEAQQPATPEPFGFTYQAEIEYAHTTGGNGSFWRFPPDNDDEAVPLYTHPAPSAPGDVVLDAKRYRWLCEDHADPETRARCREILERLPVMGYGAAVQLIDDAMLAAK